MIEEQATVVSVETEAFTAHTQRQSTCKSCSANKACGTGVLAKTMGQKHAIVSVIKPAGEQPELTPGDQVIIGLKEDILLTGSLLAYVLPLITMLVAGFIATWVGSEAAVSGEFHIILSSLAGLVAGLLIARRTMAQTKRSADFAPVFIRKLQQVSPVRDNILLP